MTKNTSNVGEKFQNFGEWFDKVLLEAQIADDRYPVKGFTVYTGWGFSIAKRIVQMLEEKLEEEDPDLAEMNQTDLPSGDQRGQPSAAASFVMLT